MTFQILQGDVIQVLRGLPAESVHCCVTSPPYWGLRDYGIEPSIWGGDPECAHEWLEGVVDTEVGRGNWAQATNGRGEIQGALEDFREPIRAASTRAFCARCQAWKGCLGLEPTVNLYLEHMVLVFREVRRVLHSSGTLWLNVGDSYCSDAGADRKPTTLPGSRTPAGWTNRAQPMRVHSSFRQNGDRDPKRGAAAEAAIYRGIAAQDSLKAKDLCMMPARCALALQADGWYLRSQIPWVKRTAMPESVTDRPTSAIEYIFLLSKSPDCFYDREAVRIASTGNAHSRGGGLNTKAKMPGPNSRMRSDKDPYHQLPSRIACKQNRSYSAAVVGTVASRARRNGDWFTESYNGLLADAGGDPLALLVNAQPFTLEMCRACGHIYQQKEYRKLPQDADEKRICTCGATAWLSHFATFPEKLVTPCVQAGTSEYGCCGHCGAPYERILEKQQVGDWHHDPENKHTAGAVNGTAKWAKNGVLGERNGDPVHSISKAVGAHDRISLPAPRTIGWKPTCDHPLYPSERVPCIVLDPFSGSARTGLAAVKLGRYYVGIEANPNYAKMSEYQFAKWKASLELSTPSETSAPPQQSEETRGNNDLLISVEKG